MRCNRICHRSRYHRRTLLRMHQPTHAHATLTGPASTTCPSPAPPQSPANSAARDQTVFANQCELEAHGVLMKRRKKGVKRSLTSETCVERFMHMGRWRTLLESILVYQLGSDSMWSRNDPDQTSKAQTHVETPACHLSEPKRQRRTPKHANFRCS